MKTYFYRLFLITFLISSIFIVFPVHPIYCPRSFAAPAAELFPPEKTVVFIAGVLKWKHGEIYSSFPEKNRRDKMLAEQFKTMGVPDSNIIYLKNEKATLENIEKSFKKALSLCEKDGTLFLYYCGHGSMIETSGGRKRSYDGLFACYDAGDEYIDGWSVNSIFSKLDSEFSGARVILAADCCHSGFLCKAAETSGKKNSYACLASSLAREQSTGNWTFTEKLVEGLKGARYIDSDGDGVVALKEIAESIGEDMAFAEGQLSSSYFGGSFNAGEIPAAAAEGNFAGPESRLEVKSGGKWYKARVVSDNGKKLKVHYFGWDYDDDEWVSYSETRKADIKEYGAGEAVKVEWKGAWYPAKVLKVSTGVHLIRYDGYDESWDEWVGASRIKSVK